MKSKETGVDATPAKISSEEEGISNSVTEQRIESGYGNPPSDSDRFTVEKHRAQSKEKKKRKNATKNQKSDDERIAELKEAIVSTPKSTESDTRDSIDVEMQKLKGEVDEINRAVQDGAVDALMDKLGAKKTFTQGDRLAFAEAQVREREQEIYRLEIQKKEKEIAQEKVRNRVRIQKLKQEIDEISHAVQVGAVGELVKKYGFKDTYSQSGRHDFAEAQVREREQEIYRLENSNAPTPDRSAKRDEAGADAKTNTTKTAPEVEGSQIISSNEVVPVSAPNGVFEALSDDDPLVQKRKKEENQKDFEALKRQRQEERDGSVNPGEQKGNNENMETGSPVGDVVTLFERNFNIKSEDLETIPGFKDLSAPQLKLLYENFNQLTLGYVQEEADQLMKTQSAEVRAKNTGRFSKYIKNGLLSMKESLTSTYRTVQTEKEVLGKMRTGGIEAHKDLLAQLIAGMPRVHETPEGELLVDLVQMTDRIKGREMRGEEYEALKELNIAAHAFSRIPSEWRDYTLGVDTHEGSKVGNFFRKLMGGKEAREREQHKKEYLNASGAYRSAQETLTAVYAKAGKSNAEVLQILAGLDSRMTQLQFLQTNPQATEVLERIDNASAWKEVIKGAVSSSRAGYFALGVGARSVAGLATGFVFAPLVSAGIASMRSWDKTAAELRDRDRMARKGVMDGSSEALNIVSSADVKEKTLRIIEKLKNAVASERPKLLSQLQARAEYIRDKQLLNRINYGPRNGVLVEQASLTAVLGEALALIAAEGQTVDSLIAAARLEKTQKSLGVTLARNQERIIAGRHEMRERVQKMDATVAAGATFAGATFAHAFADSFGSFYDKGTLPSTSELQDNSGLDSPMSPTLDVQEEVSGVAGDTAGEAPVTSDSPEVVKQFPIPGDEGLVSDVDAVLSAEVRGEEMYTIKPGDTLTDIMREQIPEIQGLSPKAQDNAIANILKSLSYEEMERIGGIGKHDVDLIYAGASLNLEELRTIVLEHQDVIDSATERFGETTELPQNTETIAQDSVAETPETQTVPRTKIHEDVELPYILEGQEPIQPESVMTQNIESDAPYSGELSENAGNTQYDTLSQMAEDTVAVEANDPRIPYGVESAEMQAYRQKETAGFFKQINNLAVGQMKIMDIHFNNYMLAMTNEKEFYSLAPNERPTVTQPLEYSERDKVKVAQYALAYIDKNNVQGTNINLYKKSLETFLSRFKLTA